jgi:hypothetical protein
MSGWRTNSRSGTLHRRENTRSSIFLYKIYLIAPAFPIAIFQILACSLVSVLKRAPAQAHGKAVPSAAQPPKQDESCLACHNQAGMKSDAGHNISIDPTKHAASVHGILGCTDCHTDIEDFPHPAKRIKVQCATCHADETSRATASVHGAIDVTCLSCHGNPHDGAAAAQLVPAKCEQCHADEVKEFRE